MGLTFLAIKQKLKHIFMTRAVCVVWRRGDRMLVIPDSFDCLPAYRLPPAGSARSCLPACPSLFIGFISEHARWPEVATGRRVRGVCLFDFLPANIQRVSG